MKKIIMAAVVGLATIFSANAQDKENRTAGAPFSKIEVNKGANVTITQSDEEYIEVFTDGCPTSDVLTSVEEGVLLVKMRKRTPGSAVKVKVYCKDLAAVEVNRGATIATETLFVRRGKFSVDAGGNTEVTLDIDVDELVVDANTSRIKIEGKAAKQSVSVAGTVGECYYNAEDLKSEDVKIKAIASDCKVSFTGSLVADAIGCTIEYDGPDAKVKKTEKARGHVVKMQ